MTPDGSAAEPHGWLHAAREHWIASDQQWPKSFLTWAREEGLHTWEQLLGELDRRFDRVICRRGPYFFADLDGTSEADELQAIDAARIRATRIDYVGRAST